MAAGIQNAVSLSNMLAFYTSDIAANTDTYTSASTPLRKGTGIASAPSMRRPKV